VLPDAEFSEDCWQTIPFNGFDWRRGIGDPKDVVTFVLIASRCNFVPERFHVTIVFITVRDHEHVITLKRYDELVFHSAHYSLYDCSKNS